MLFVFQTLSGQFLHNLCNFFFFAFVKLGHSHLLKMDIISEDDQNVFKAKAGNEVCESTLSTTIVALL